MALAPDTSLGPYKIISLIGEGGMGEVYRARDTRIGRDVAIKVLSASVTQDKDRFLRFQQEAKAAGILNHPNLLSIFDVGGEEETPYIVSELLEGENLRERLEKSPLPIRKVIDYALQIAHGLAAAHDKGIVHRDLKPENIFIMTEGRVKILDFGIAKLNPQLGADGPSPSPGAQLATEPGMVMGTVGYMSPEQVRGEQLDQRSDIFSFGTILYEMLTGIRAFKRETSIETLGAILKEEPPDFAEVNAHIPPEIERIVRHCLEKNRQQRFQSARDLAFHLESLGLALSSRPAMTSPPGFRTSEGSAAPLRSSGTMPGGEVSSDAPTLLTSPPRTAGSPVASRPATSARPPVRQGPTAARPALPPQRLQPRIGKVRQILGALFLALVCVAGGMWAGWALEKKMRRSEVASFQRITFRRGEVNNARFAPDGDTIVYSAAWDGNATELFLTRRQTPESRPFGIPGAEIAAISRSGEMAIFLRRDRISGLGTLARAPLVGGTPREVATSVLQADWSPDGQQLAIIRRAGRSFRIESPIGKVIYETARPINSLRVAPVTTTSRLAFVEPDRGQNHIVMIENGQHEIIATGWRHGINGLAWSPDGKEVWFTGSDAGSAPPALYAVAPGREPRMITRLTGSLRLQDISPSGRVLLTHNTWRSSLMGLPPGETVERDFSWLDWSILSDLSRDGKTLLFNETREGGGAGSSVYVRRTDGSPPIRLGDGFADGISPDGRWALAHRGMKLILLPTGAGEPRELKTIEAFGQGALFLPDGSRFVIAGAEKGKDYRLFLQDVMSDRITPLSPEGIWDGGFRPFAVSPDGARVAGMNKDKKLTLYSTAGGVAEVVAEALPEEIPIQWSADGISLFVYRPTELPARIYRIDLANHARELWKEFALSDPAGVYRVSPILMTPDATSYSYNSLRTLSDLYVAEGLK